MYTFYCEMGLTFLNENDVENFDAAIMLGKLSAAISKKYYEAGNWTHGQIFKNRAIFFHNVAVKFFDKF